LTEHVFDVSKDSGVMNQTADATDVLDRPIDEATARIEPGTSTTAVELPASTESPAMESAVKTPDSIRSETTSDQNLGESTPMVSAATVGDEAQSKSVPSDDSLISTPGTEASNSDQGEAKKTRAPRTPKAASKTAEPGGSITSIVERVVRMTALSEEHAVALGRLFSVSLPDDYVARLTRLTGASLGPIGNGAAEALAIVLGLESANPIHVGVQLGRLAQSSLPDVYRCAHALTGEAAPPLPKGDTAVFAVADVLATLTTNDFALARALSSALE
jgi:hypothetical protein